MEPSEALSAGAQVAATLAGFAGVVVVFGPGAVHQWSALDRFRLQLMLTYSTLPLALCLIGLLLLSTSLPEGSGWSWCSGLALGSLLPSGVFNYRRFSALPAQQLQASPSSKPVFYSLSVIGLGVILLQLYNIVGLHQFWPFFSTIVVGLLASTLQFMRMILSRQGPQA